MLGSRSRNMVLSSIFAEKLMFSRGSSFFFHEFQKIHKHYTLECLYPRIVFHSPLSAAAAYAVRFLTLPFCHS
ncbi:hypothetical protein Y032_0944g3153 [Ancylostoma ceylanicum]|uniref:Uncharacterized protein n=1 Tax=Ancylostoma ceylanicum TaxID=53326 RepID=A0A016W8Y9_9BILA|nr:hypothetical protein Y032_0944g3153 [Ancylostoma ceylanicum]